MSRYKKGAAVVLLIITVAVIALTFIFILSLISKTGIISTIKNDVDYYIVQEDRGRSLLSFVNSRKEDSSMNYLTLLGSSASQDFQQKDEIKTSLTNIKEVEELAGCSLSIVYKNQQTNFESLGSKTTSALTVPSSSFGCVIGEKEETQIELKKFPVEGDTCITSSYGWRKLPGNDFHEGVDFGVRQSAFNNIVAADDGTVVFVYNGCKDSSYINLDPNEKDAWDACYTAEELKSLNDYEKTCVDRSGAQWADCYSQSPFQSPCLCDGGRGNMVILGHKFEPADTDFGYYTVYYHLAEKSIPDKIKKGEYVTAGTLLGVIGNTGRSTAAHLHFGITKENIKSPDFSGLDPYEQRNLYYDPCPYLAELDDYQKMKNVGNCKACCDAPCHDKTLKDDQDSKIEQCTDRGFSLTEGMAVPIPGGEIGLLQMMKW